MISAYFQSPLLLYFTYCSILLFLIYKWATWYFNLGDKFEIRGPRPLPLFGNIFDYMKYGFVACDLKYKKRYGDVYTVYIGRKRILVVSDDALLRQMLVKVGKSFTDRSGIPGMSRLMRKNLVHVQGKDWERIRNLLTPSFTTGKLKKMSPLLLASVNNMIQRIEKGDNMKFDVKELFGLLMMDAIGRAMFGIEINSSETNFNAFTMHGKKLFELPISNITFTIMSIFPVIGKIIDYMYPDGIISPESERYLIKELSTAIECRRKSNEEYHDFLALMLKAHEEVPDNKCEVTNNPNFTLQNKLSDEEIMAQALVFLFGGFETTASLLTYCAYYLSKDQNAQQEIFNNLMGNLTDDKEITYEMLDNLNLIDQCLNETLRICPSISRISRICTKDTIVTSSTGQMIHMKKGMEFVVPIYAIHHDENIWPNPEKFDIHRFDRDEKKSRSTFSFLPFGMGPRNCIGLKFGLTEAKFALAHILKDYKILPCDQTLGPFRCNVFAIPQIMNPIYVRFRKR